jgi:hypothetical protein
VLPPASADHNKWWERPVGESLQLKRLEWYRHTSIGLPPPLAAPFLTTNRRSSPAHLPHARPSIASPCHQLAAASLHASRPPLCARCRRDRQTHARLAHARVSPFHRRAHPRLHAAAPSRERHRLPSTPAQALCCEVKPPRPLSRVLARLRPHSTPRRPSSDG